jgi:hypothetical protein
MESATAGGPSLRRSSCLALQCWQGSQKANTGSTPQLDAEIREIHRVKPVVLVHQEKSIHIWRGKPTTRLPCRFTPRLGQRGTTALGHAAISYEFPNVGR